MDSARIHIIEMDQNSLSSVRSAADKILEKTSKIHLLVNNAEIMGIPELRFTADGHELQFGTNHLSHFLFFQLLQPALLKNASPELPSRVINLSSAAYLYYGINDSDDYNFEKSEYISLKSYSQSKTANIYFANEIERRFGSRHLPASSVHPGIIATGLPRHLPPDAFKGMDYLYPTMKSVEQGAATSILAAVRKDIQRQAVKYFVDCEVAKPYREVEEKLTSKGYSPWAFDAEKAGRLWWDSLKIVGLSDN